MRRYFLMTTTVLLFVSSWTRLQAEDVERLLENFSVNNALSSQTIDQNKGHLILFTRRQLERMRAHSLKDVFKATPVIYYHENRYALPDPLAGPSYSPYISSFIRIFIDGVEVTSGWMGSGLLLYGDMNIDFVDHIEFYYALPSFETSIEPAYMTIFLYSKQPSHDRGGKLFASQGSRGYNEQAVSYTDEYHDTAYMVHLSHTDAKRSKVDNGTAQALSRDYERWQFVSYFKTGNHRFHFNAVSKKSDGFAGSSMDATPVSARLDYLNLHADYEVEWENGWRFSTAYEHFTLEGDQVDDYPSIFIPPTKQNLFELNFKALLTTYSGELTYKTVWGDHHIALGAKGRIKHFDEISTPTTGNIPLSFDTEFYYSAFIQDQYILSDRHLFNIGLELSSVKRNGIGTDDNDLVHFRIGYIYNGDQWHYKAYAYRMMFVPETYLYYFANSGLSPNAFRTPQKTMGLTQEVSYESRDNTLRFLMFFMKDDNGLLRSDLMQKNSRYFFTVMNYDHRISLNDTFRMQLYYAHYQYVFNLNRLKDWSGYFSYAGSYESFDYDAGLIWHRNNLDYKHYFDLNVALTWNITQEFSVGIKGENLLNKAKKTGLFRLDPTSMQMMEPLPVSPFDRRISIEAEYSF